MILPILAYYTRAGGLKLVSLIFQYQRKEKLMALVKRISQLFTADAHAVLDLIEDPITLLKQAVREMETEIQAQQAKLNQEKKHLMQTESQIAKAEQELETIDQDLDLCFEEENQSLARSLVKRKLLVKRNYQNLKDALQHSKNLVDTQSKLLQDNQTRYESMKQQAELLNQQQSTTEETSKFDSFSSISEEEVEIALLNEKRARSHS